MGICLITTVILNPIPAKGKCLERKVRDKQVFLCSSTEGSHFILIEIGIERVKLDRHQGNKCLLLNLVITVYDFSTEWKTPF